MAGDDPQLPDVVPGGPTHAARPVGGTPDQRDVVLTQFSEHSGPLPDEQWFQTVEALHPGATGKLLDDYVADREHARAMEQKQVELDDKNLSGFIGYQYRRLGLVGALAILVIVASIVLIAVGLPVYGLALILAELGALLAVFFGTQRRQQPSPSPPDENP